MVSHPAGADPTSLGDVRSALPPSPGSPGYLENRFRQVSAQAQTQLYLPLFVSLLSCLIVGDNHLVVRTGLAEEATASAHVQQMASSVFGKHTKNVALTSDHTEKDLQNLLAIRPAEDASAPPPPTPSYHFHHRGQGQPAAPSSLASASVGAEYAYPFRGSSGMSLDRKPSSSTMASASTGSSRARPSSLSSSDPAASSSLRPLRPQSHLYPPPSIAEDEPSTNPSIPLYEAATSEQRPSMYIPSVVVLSGLERASHLVLLRLAEVLRSRQVELDDGGENDEDEDEDKQEQRYTPLQKQNSAGSADLTEDEFGGMMRRSRAAVAKNFRREGGEQGRGGSRSATGAGGAARGRRSIWNLPKGFLLVWMLPDGERVSEWFLDLFSLSCLMRNVPPIVPLPPPTSSSSSTTKLTALITPTEIAHLRALTLLVPVSPKLKAYVADLSSALLHHPHLTSRLTPRSRNDTLDFVRIARVLFRPFAAEGEDGKGASLYASPVDVVRMWRNVVRHRVRLRARGEEMLRVVKVDAGGASGRKEEEGEKEEEEEDDNDDDDERSDIWRQNEVDRILAEICMAV